MPTLEDLRNEARLPIATLARKAGVDIKTVKRAIDGAPVTKIKVHAILNALSKKLGRSIKLEDVDGLNISYSVPRR